MNKILDQTTFGKGVRITLEKHHSIYPKEMQKELKTNQETAKAFAEAFAKKTEKVVSEVKVNKKEVHKWKRKIF